MRKSHRIKTIIEMMKITVLVLIKNLRAIFKSHSFPMISVWFPDPLQRTVKVDSNEDGKDKNLELKSSIYIFSTHAMRSESTKKNYNQSKMFLKFSEYILIHYFKVCSMILILNGDFKILWDFRTSSRLILYLYLVP